MSITAPSTVASHHDVPELADVSTLDELVAVGQGGAKAGGEMGIRLQDRETGQWYSFWRGPPGGERLEECEDAGQGGWAASGRSRQRTRAPDRRVPGATLPLPREACPNPPLTTSKIPAVSRGERPRTRLIVCGPNCAITTTSITWRPVPSCWMRTTTACSDGSRALEELHPDLIAPDSPTQRVGAEPQGQLETLAP